MGEVVRGRRVDQSPFGTLLFSAPQQQSNPCPKRGAKEAHHFVAKSFGVAGGPPRLLGIAHRATVKKCSATLTLTSGSKAPG
eukprot:scaffold242821_cov27-Tisochrysis_lutea.AAC.1